MIKITGLKEISSWLDGIDSKLQRDAVVAVTNDVFKNAKELAHPHRRTGVMEDNIEKGNYGDAGLVWISDRNMLVDWKGKKINYASFVLFGSEPHKIEAKNKKSLMYAGLNDFVKSKEHNGYEGDNFLEKATQETFKNLDNIYKGVLDGIK